MSEYLPVLIYITGILLQSSVHIKTEKGPQLHLGSPVDYSNDFEVYESVNMEPQEMCNCSQVTHVFFLSKQNAQHKLYLASLNVMFGQQANLF